MREYETIYILKPDLPADATQAVQARIKDILQKQKGHLLALTDWGKRKLAYRVEKMTHGQYFYSQYLDTGHSVAEIERILRNDDRVLKFMTVKIEDKINVEERLAQPVTPPAPPEEISHYEGFDRGAGRGGRPPRDNAGGFDDDVAIDLNS